MNIPHVYLTRQIVTLRVTTVLPISLERARGLFEGNWTMESAHEDVEVEVRVEVMGIEEERLTDTLPES